MTHSTNMSLKKCRLTDITREGLTIEVLFDPESVECENTILPATQPNAKSNSIISRLPHDNHDNTVISIELQLSSGEAGYEALQASVGYIELMASPLENTGQPSTVLLQWDRLHLEGVVDSVTTNYTLFDNEGFPCRATVFIRLSV